MTQDNKNPAASSRREELKRVESTSNQALLDKLDRLLAKAKPSKRELTQQYFRNLYPKLEAYLSKGTPLKDVLAAFNELAQAKVCARTFNDMFEQERARRDHDNNAVCCSACGSRLAPKPDDFANLGSIIPALDTPISE